MGHDDETILEDVICEVPLESKLRENLIRTKTKLEKILELLSDRASVGDGSESEPRRLHS